jgi:hypothetical protein
LTEWIARVLNEEDIIPTYDELSNYRGARDLDFLDIWCTYFFPAVVGTWYFKKNATQTHLSSFVMVSDEAFALTVIKNNPDSLPPCC